MDQDRRWRPGPPILDMTPEGGFREPAPSRSWLDRALARVGGVALLLALATGGLVVVALAFVLLGLLLPVAIVAGLVGMAIVVGAGLFTWWRSMQRTRAGTAPR